MTYTPKSSLRLGLTSKAVDQSQPESDLQLAISNINLNQNLSSLIPDFTIVSSRHRINNPMLIPHMRARKEEKTLPTVSGFPLKRQFLISDPST